VEIVRRLMTAFNLRDHENVLALMDADVEFFAPQTALSVERHASYHGHDGIRQYFEDVGGVWTTLQLIPQEFRFTDSHVVALGTIVGERDGEYIDDEVAWAWKLRGGKIVWGRVYQEPDEALEDTGIEPQQ
jgi:ketosteroid isomerase-like protein